MGKVAIVGAGNVGANVANLLAMREACKEVVVLDLAKELTEGKAMDMFQAALLSRSATRVVAASDYEQMKDAAVVVITAGSPRKPGMTREDLLLLNASIVHSVAKEVARVAPEAVVIVVSNPLDAMVYVALKATGFPKERVLGMAGVLDSTRMAHAIVEVAGFGEGQAQALVIGGHGDSMVPLPRFSSLGGIPLSLLLQPEQIATVVEKTRHGGARLVSLMGTSAYYAPATAIFQMIHSILGDFHMLLPCATLLEGEYGCHDVVNGVVVALGSQGVARHVELPLNPEELRAFTCSAQEVSEQIMLLKSQFSF